MSNPSDVYQRFTAWMHSQPGRAFHRQGQQWFESNYVSIGALWSKDIKHPSVALPLSATESALDSWIASNPGILRKYTTYVLTAEATSNNEMYYINDVGNGGWQTQIVQEHHVSDPATLQPSNAYIVKLFQGTGGLSPGTQISPSEGRWALLPALGGVFFENGYTPIDMTWGAITITCYVYIGDTVADISGGTSDENFSYERIYGRTVIIPVNQQMIVHDGEIIIDDNGNLDINGSLIIEP